MQQVISAISDFIQKILAIGIISSGILLFAAEIKLAALKKASHGSVKLSTFTQKMTKTKVDYK
jgi:hypothetical protein